MSLLVHPRNMLADAGQKGTVKHSEAKGKKPRSRRKNRQPYDLDSITEVAIKVFNQHGYDGTSMEQIARAAGIKKASLYHHIASKEELLARALDRALNPLFAVLSEPGAIEGRAVERLKYIVRRAVEIELQFLPEVSLVLRVRGNTKTERRAIERRREFDAVMTNLVLQAVREGDVRADLNPALVTRLLFGMTNWLVEWYRPDGSLSGSEIVHSILAFAFEGIGKR
jgi:AcrR family transcriptional regulator